MSCQQHEDHIIAHAADGRLLEASAAEHLVACVACRARLERDRRWINELRELPVHSAPGELDLLVVEAIDGDALSGTAARQRTERAINGLTDLGAPPELDALVSQVIGEAGRGLRAGRHIGMLADREVPSALDGYVVASMHAGHRQDRAAVRVANLTPLRAVQHEGEQERTAVRRSAWRWSPLAAAAAALLLLFVFDESERRPAGAQPEAATYSFRIVRLDPSDNQRAQSLLNGVAGITVAGGEAR